MSLKQRKMPSSFTDQQKNLCPPKARVVLRAAMIFVVCVLWISSFYSRLVRAHPNHSAASNSHSSHPKPMSVIASLLKNASQANPNEHGKKTALENTSAVDPSPPLSSSATNNLRSSGNTNSQSFSDPGFSKRNLNPSSSVLQSLSDELAFLSPLPKPKSGVCREGVSYSIQSGADLRSYRNDLECVFQLGTVPSRPPLGVWYGGVISLLNSGVYSEIGENVWLGKQGLKTQCRDSDSSFSMIMNYVFGDLAFPAYVYLGKLRDPILPGEVDNGKDYLFVDYTVNFADLCPVGSDFEMNGNLAGFSSGYFVSSVVDVARVVGFTNDGGQIILGKTFFRDIASFPDIGDMTIAWWFVINYDSGSFPVDLSPGQLLGPQIVPDFTYYYRGLFDTYGILNHFLGLQQFKTNPLQALQRLLYFLFIKPVLAQPPSPGSDIEALTADWPLAGFPNPGYEVEAVTGIPGPTPKSGRLPGLPNPLGSPLAVLSKLFEGFAV